jgi:hypothetical protein
MPEARRLKKPVNSIQGDPVKTEVLRTRREPTIMKFSADALRSLGQEHAILTAMAPEGMSFECALIPEAWAQVAYRAARPREWVGSDIVLHGHDYKWRANLQILAIVRDAFKQPCGLKVACVGPSVDPKTGKAVPINAATGLPWVDPKEAAEEAA